MTGEGRKNRPSKEAHNDHMKPSAMRLSKYSKRPKNPALTSPVNKGKDYLT